MPPWCFCTESRLFARFYWTKIIKQPAYNLINLFYVCEYCNPVGCLLILFYIHITECHFVSMAHLLSASVKRVPRLETRCAGRTRPEPRAERERESPRFSSRTFIPSLPDGCRLCQTCPLAVWKCSARLTCRPCFLGFFSEKGDSCIL